MSILLTIVSLTSSTEPGINSGSSVSFSVLFVFVFFELGKFC